VARPKNTRPRNFSIKNRWLSARCIDSGLTGRTVFINGFIHANTKQSARFAEWMTKAAAWCNARKETT